MNDLLTVLGNNDGIVTDHESLTLENDLATISNHLGGIAQSATGEGNLVITVHAEGDIADESGSILYNNADIAYSIGVSAGVGGGVFVNDLQSTGGSIGIGSKGQLVKHHAVELDLVATGEPDSRDIGSYGLGSAYGIHQVEGDLGFCRTVINDGKSRPITVIVAQRAGSDLALPAVGYNDICIGPRKDKVLVSRGIAEACQGYVVYLTGDHRNSVIANVQSKLIGLLRHGDLNVGQSSRLDENLLQSLTLNGDLQSGCPGLATVNAQLNAVGSGKDVVAAFPVSLKAVLLTVNAGERVVNVVVIIIGHDVAEVGYGNDILDGSHVNGVVVLIIYVSLYVYGDHVTCLHAGEDIGIIVHVVSVAVGIAPYIEGYELALCGDGVAAGLGHYVIQTQIIIAIGNVDLVLTVYNGYLLKASDLPVKAKACLGLAGIHQRKGYGLVCLGGSDDQSINQVIVPCHSRCRGGNGVNTCLGEGNGNGVQRVGSQYTVCAAHRFKYKILDLDYVVGIIHGGTGYRLPGIVSCNDLLFTRGLHGEYVYGIADEALFAPFVDSEYTESDIGGAGRGNNVLTCFQVQLENVVGNHILCNVLELRVACGCVLEENLLHHIVTNIALVVVVGIHVLSLKTLLAGMLAGCGIVVSLTGDGVCGLVGVLMRLYVTANVTGVVIHTGMSALFDGIDRVSTGRILPVVLLIGGPTLVVGMLAAGVFTNVTRAVVVLVNVIGLILLAHAVTASSVMPVLGVVDGPLGLVIVSTLFIICANITNTVVVSIRVGSGILGYGMSARCLVPVRIGVGSPSLFICVGVRFNALANVTHQVAIAVYVRAQSALFVGVLTGSFVPVIGFIISPISSIGVGMRLFLVAGCQNRQNQQHGED